MSPVRNADLKASRSSVGVNAELEILKSNPMRSIEGLYGIRELPNGALEFLRYPLLAVNLF